MKRSLTGEMRVCSDALDKASAAHRNAAATMARRASEASRLLRRASEENFDLRRQLEGARAYARLLEKRLGIAA